MIQKVVNKRNLNDSSSIKEDLAYWLNKTPEERVETVDYLRRQYHGSTARLQRSARVIQRTDILSLVRQSATKRILILPHAVRQMSRPDRMISVAEVRRVVENGELVEDYPEDVRGHSCLILGYGEGGRSIHVVCSPKIEYLAVITAYLPSEQEWEDNFRKRKQS